MMMMIVRQKEVTHKNEILFRWMHELNWRRAGDRPKFCARGERENERGEGGEASVNEKWRMGMSRVSKKGINRKQLQRILRSSLSFLLFSGFTLRFFLYSSLVPSLFVYDSSCLLRDSLPTFSALFVVQFCLLWSKNFCSPRTRSLYCPQSFSFCIGNIFLVTDVRPMDVWHPRFTLTGEKKGQPDKTMRERDTVESVMGTEKEMSSLQFCPLEKEEGVVLREKWEEGWQRSFRWWFQRKKREKHEGRIRETGQVWPVSGGGRRRCRGMKETGRNRAEEWMRWFWEIYFKRLRM